ncbi:MAG: MexE family multidrug efflux RND transporter periplasmic adaptor subunit [Aureliella sp.]
MSPYTFRLAISAWIFALLPAIFLGCSSGGRGQQPTREPPVVICTPALSQEVTDYDEFVGRTQASETVDVSARLSGYLRSVEFDDGQMVQEGDLLAKIEPDEYEAIHDQALANVELWKSKLKLAQTTLARFKELIANDAVSQSEYDESFAAVEEAQAQVTAAEAATKRTALDLKYTEIHAPISGRVDRRFITAGNMVTGGLGAGTILTRIVNDTPMHAYIDVDEQSILDYKRRTRRAGSEPTSGSLRELSIPCYLQLQDEEDFPHEGVLDFAENRVDASTGTIRIRAVYPNEDHLLQGGLFVRVRIPKGEPYQGVLIPEEAIALDQADRIVYVVNSKNEVERRQVELGARFGTLRSIRSGVKAGEQVVYKGLQRVRPGVVVQPEIQEVTAELSSGGEAAAEDTALQETAQ